jgi:putative transposase
MGNCWDNAVAESFFGSLKQDRLQSYMGYMSPNQYEVEMAELKNAA